MIRHRHPTAFFRLGFVLWAALLGRVQADPGLPPPDLPPLDPPPLDQGFQTAVRREVQGRMLERLPPLIYAQAIWLRIPAEPCAGVEEVRYANDRLRADPEVGRFYWGVFKNDPSGFFGRFEACQALARTVEGTEAERRAFQRALKLPDGQRALRLKALLKAKTEAVAEALQNLLREFYSLADINPPPPDLERRYLALAWAPFHRLAVAHFRREQARARELAARRALESARRIADFLPSSAAAPPAVTAPPASAPAAQPAPSPITYLHLPPAGPISPEAREAGRFLSDVVRSTTLTR
ncbi:MAG: hypothetical protein HY552_05440, partial [Elusimicrobia bacterium]|nr:hypothetical protein [Elusimicrobiota bacterium]